MVIFAFFFVGVVNGSVIERVIFQMSFKGFYEEAQLKRPA